MNDPPIPRDLLSKYFGKDPRLVIAFENLVLSAANSERVIVGTVGATEALQDASVLTLSSNGAFTNEFVLGDGDGTKITVGEGTASIDVDDTVVRSEGFKVTLSPPADVLLELPPEGKLVSDVVPMLPYLTSASGDSAAATAGVPLGGLYHNGGVVRVRLV